MYWRLTMTPYNYFRACLGYSAYLKGDFGSNDMASCG